MNVNEISKKLKKYRKRNNLSVDYVSEKIGINRATIYRYESGEIKNIPYNHLLSLCELYNVDIRDFIEQDVITEGTVKNTITGERLKISREKLKMSQIDVADKVGVSKQTLYKYENGIISTIPYDKIYNFAKLYNVSPSYLVRWENEIGSFKSTGQNINKDLDSMNDNELLELINKASSIMYSRKKSK